MPAGIKYNTNPIEGTMPEMLRYDTVYRYSGGFNLDISNLSGVKQIPPVTPLSLDFKNRKAKAVINVKAVEALASDGTALKVKKGSLAYVGMVIGNGKKIATVSAIDKTNAGYDTLTISALGDAISSNEVLFEVEAYKITANVAADATTAKVTKGAPVKVGDTVNIGGIETTVSAIDTSNENYDSLTITALGTAKSSNAAAFTVGQQKTTAKALNYAWTKVEEGATVTAIGRAFEIKESKLIAPVSEKDKESLGDRFMFIDDAD